MKRKHTPGKSRPFEIFLPTDRPSQDVVVPAGSQSVEEQNTTFIHVYETVTVWRERDGILVESNTFGNDQDDEYDQGGALPDGVSWQEEAPPQPEFVEGMLTYGRNIHDHTMTGLEGIDPTEALYEGSPHTAVDFARFVLAMKYTTSKCNCVTSCLPVLCFLMRVRLH